MTQARDFLQRFRPAGAPGAAGSAGVPADRAREQEAELGGVLALLDDVQAECERIVSRARQEADRIAAAARMDAAAILEQAARQATAAREESARQTLARAEADARAPVVAARREAERIGRSARARMPALVAQAVGWARSGPGGPLAAGGRWEAGEPGPGGPP